jgi:hypothetical protein
VVCHAILCDVETTNDGNGADSGHVHIYSYDGSAWVQQ